MLIIVKRDNLFKLFGFVSNLADREASTASLCRDVTDVGRAKFGGDSNVEFGAGGVNGCGKRHL